MELSKAGESGHALADSEPEVTEKVVRKCTACRNHSILVPCRGHKHSCPHRDCECRPCQLTRRRRNSMREQTRAVRFQRRLEKQQRVESKLGITAEDLRKFATALRAYAAVGSEGLESIVKVASVLASADPVATERTTSCASSTSLMSILNDDVVQTSSDEQLLKKEQLQLAANLLSGQSASAPSGSKKASPTTCTAKPNHKVSSMLPPHMLMHGESGNGTVLELPAKISKPTCSSVVSQDTSSSSLAAGMSFGQSTALSSVHLSGLCPPAVLPFQEQTPGTEGIGPWLMPNYMCMLNACVPNSLSSSQPAQTTTDSQSTSLQLCDMLTSFPPSQPTPPKETCSAVSSAQFSQVAPLSGHMQFANLPPIEVLNKPVSSGSLSTNSCGL